MCEKSNWREGVNTPSLFPCFYAFIKSKSSISTRSSAAVASCNESSFLAMVTSGTNCYKSCCVGPVPGTIRVETLLMGRRLLYGVTGFDALQGGEVVTLHHLDKAARRKLRADEDVGSRCGLARVDS